MYLYSRNVIISWKELSNGYPSIFWKWKVTWIDQIIRSFPPFLLDFVYLSQVKAGLWKMEEFSHLPSSFSLWDWNFLHMVWWASMNEDIPGSLALMTSFILGCSLAISSRRPLDVGLSSRIVIKHGCPMVIQSLDISPYPSSFEWIEKVFNFDHGKPSQFSWSIQNIIWDPWPPLVVNTV